VPDDEGDADVGADYEEEEEQQQQPASKAARPAAAPQQRGKESLLVQVRAAAQHSTCIKGADAWQ
jgi:hypothetical protein